MNFLIFSLVLLFSIGMLFAAGNTLFDGIKKFERGEFSGWDTDPFFEFFIAGLLLISEKWLPKRYHIVLFKIITLLFGVLLLVVAVFLLWYFYDQLFN
ncbi:hypothetical protein CN514_00735 [Bacillus sp. AFS001701]|uniref:hypothetical protein n=1 Tax=Bacillus sp. AFS001701 TaxID=2033480 RepID=UPI000BF3583C|nr:hypothetical protein [Bacillus sp. AFS001701]PET77556.1 hypothetical protein CN514_00735 [Bacillus sp. AFS001701]